MKVTMSIRSNASKRVSYISTDMSLSSAVYETSRVIFKDVLFSRESAFAIFAYFAFWMLIMAFYHAVQWFTTSM